MLIGAGTMTLALTQLLLRAGLHVTILEDDSDVAARLATRLSQIGVSASITGTSDPETASRMAQAGMVVLTVPPTTPAETAIASAAAQQGGRAVLLCETDAELAMLGSDPALSVAALRLVVPGSGLVELFATANPGPAKALADVMGRLGCTALHVPTGAEGAATRLISRLLATTEALCMAGANPWELDEAAEALGFADGPCALMDRLGVDTVLPRRTRLRSDGVALPDPGIIARMVSEGRLGRKASVGWYRYPGGGGRVIDPLIEDLVREEAWFARLPQRDFEADRIQSHLVAALMDEGAMLVAEGAVSRPGDVDLAAALGLGFPAQLGGPVWLAARFGSEVVQSAIAALRVDLEGISGV